MTSPNLNVTAIGTSPIFSVAPQDFLLRRYTQVSPVPGSWVQPPALGIQGGPSFAMNFTNRWYPWIDEKLCEPKYDGVCQYLGIASNRPTYVKDYHMIALNRAVDMLLNSSYTAYIQAKVTGPAPTPPPTS